MLWFALTRDAAGIDWKCVTTAGAWRQLEYYLWPEIHKWVGRLNWDVIGRRPRVARAQLEAAGLRVDQREAPVGDPRQDGRVVFQIPQAGTTVGRGSTVTIVVGVRPGDNDGGGGNG